MSTPRTLAGFWRDLWRQIALSFRGVWRLIRRNSGTLLIALISVLSIAFMLWFWDKQILAGIRDGGRGNIHETARFISFWGDFVPYSLPLAILIWLIGRLLAKLNWQVIGMCCLLASATAGIGANIFRLTVGRPRPAANLPDGFYGLQRKSHFHGFPSGHSATAFGTGTSLLAPAPALGIPLTIYGASVGWSRMELNRHHLTDVLVGGFLGSVAGVLFGLVAWRTDKLARRAFRGRGSIREPAQL